MTKAAHTRSESAAISESVDKILARGFERLRKHKVPNQPGHRGTEDVNGRHAKRGRHSLSATGRTRRKELAVSCIVAWLDVVVALDVFGFLTPAQSAGGFVSASSATPKKAEKSLRLL